MRRMYTILLLLLVISTKIYPTDNVPSINPTATFHLESGDVVCNDTTGSAPLSATLNANTENIGGYTATYEWRFYTPGNSSQPFLVRYDESTDYIFEKSGTTYVELYATFVNGSDTIKYESEYWENAKPISVTVSESKLEVPNAFSPNGDGINDTFHVKDGYQSLVDFHAYIYNRWGQLLFDWTNPADGWDGTYKGHQVKDGVYFVLVKAKGADGIKYNIKRDVNLLRGYTESSTTK
jgi:gliding motility-associated-like protein